MTGDRAASLAFLLIALTLPLSALIARRTAPGRTVRLALIWIAIIGGLTIAISLATNRLNFT